MSKTSRMLIGQALRLLALAVEKWGDADHDEEPKASDKIDLLTIEEERTRDLLRSRGFKL